MLPVKVVIDKETHLAHTIGITSGGARLGAKGPDGTEVGAHD